MNALVVSVGKFGRLAKYAVECAPDSDAMGCQIFVKLCGAAEPEPSGDDLKGFFVRIRQARRSANGQAKFVVEPGKEIVTGH